MYPVMCPAVFGVIWIEVPDTTAWPNNVILLPRLESGPVIKEVTPVVCADAAPPTANMIIAISVGNAFKTFSARSKYTMTSVNPGGVPPARE
jgi:hypothetical protein